MTSSHDRTLGNAFFTAVLLTRSSECAERAVEEALSLWDGRKPLEEDFLAHTAAACIHQSVCQSPLSAEEVETAISMIPLGLHGVMRLPVHLRRCYVLRLLVRLPLAECARLLNLPRREIERYTCAALSRLPAAKARSTQLIGWNLLYRTERTYYEQT